MTTTARERLAAMLGAKTPSAMSSVQLKAGTSDLRLEVDGIGRIQLPIPAEQARRLCELGRPARFGRGEETLTDPKVRDTWEIPKGLVRAEWSNALGAVLDAVRDELGLPSHCELTADLHSMLVYEPGQFFVAHQDSEKDDTMIGSLVVTLPSAHTGGELVIEHGGDATTYRGSKSALSLVAFYADCRHEVRPVKSGHRVTLTYNLLLKGDTGGPITGDDATVSELARCLDEHFTTPATNRYSRTAADPPNRLVYLLGHSYTARGLGWSRLKGTDAGRASLLRAAADRAGCATALALADVQETWSTYEPDYGYRDWDDEGEPDEYGSDDYEVEELIDSSVRLTRWTVPAGTGSEEVSLDVSDDEVCASTPSADLQPYDSEYEGYMGNYGNTLDRWYRRAAVVVWPRDRDFTNRAEASPTWALDELRERARAGDPAGARAAAATLAPFWDVAARTQDQAGLFGKALQTADVLDDAETAGMLLRPLRIESLRPADAAPLAKLAGRYGEDWLGDLIRMWFGDRQSWAYADGQDRPEWAATLPGLCEALLAAGGPGRATAHRLLEHTWDWIGETIRFSLAAPTPSHRDKWLGALGQPLASLLTAAAVTGAVGLREEIVGFSRKQGDEMITWVMPALRAAGSLPAHTRRDGGFDDLAADCAARLRARLTRPPRADDDWSIEPPDGCACELCGTLGAFLRDPAQRTLEWPLAEQRRRHVHSRIAAAELPVRHQTRRKGRPYTLVLTKSQTLFDLERQARNRDEADLEWLATERHSQ
jgi:2OG-Fe(II) oxygenase superfamily